MQQHAPADDPIPGYRFERELKRGGMGVVYLARDGAGGRVVIKMIRPDLADNQLYRDRFDRETKAARRVAHPNVVKVLDAGRVGETSYLVMEYVDGPTLKEEIDRLGALSVAAAVDVVVQIAGALDAVHQEGLTHGDVTPSNILLSASAPQRRALLTDFGLARQATGGSLSGSGNWAASGYRYGTQGYMAPEQQAGDSATPVTDVWALAAVFLTALIGGPPHAGMGQASAQRSDLPALVDSVIATAMKRNPAERYRSAGEFAEALHRTVVARTPVTSPTRPRVRPRWKAVAAGAMVLLVGASAAAGMRIADLARHDVADGAVETAPGTPHPPFTPSRSVTPSPSPSATPTRSSLPAPSEKTQTPAPKPVEKDLQKLELRLDPSSFDVRRSAWSPYGPLYEANNDLYDRYGVPRAHAYGNTAGLFLYPFDIQSFEGARAELTARLSADASGYRGPSDGYSDVTVVINGVSLPVRRVMPDDGRGTHYTWQFDANLLRLGQNTVEFRVEADATFSNGLCIYGGAIAPGFTDEWIMLRTE